MDKSKIVTGIVILAAVIVFTGSTFWYQKRTTNTLTSRNLNFKDGTYTQDGNYVSPEGPESITVSITLKKGRVVDSTIISNAPDGNSKEFQAKFIDGYKEFVTGKNINEVKLDKVSGSSLTPKGFNDAIEKIKTDASV